jgi:hypothetical protein
MSAPRKAPSCPHLSIVVVRKPHQVVYDGVVYLGGEEVYDVPNPTAAEWVSHGWADDLSGRDTAPAKPPPARTAAKK